LEIAGPLLDRPPERRAEKFNLTESEGHTAVPLPLLIFVNWPSSIALVLAAASAPARAIAPAPESAFLCFAAIPHSRLVFINWRRPLLVASCLPPYLLLLDPPPSPRSPPFSASARMSATGIAVPPELDQDVSKWSEDDVETFLTANMEKYGLKDTVIQAVRGQEVCGIILVWLDGEELERWGILGGPAKSIVKIVEQLKMIKGLVMPGK
jgi:hypothetical protein